MFCSCRPNCASGNSGALLPCKGMSVTSEHRDCWNFGHDINLTQLPPEVCPSEPRRIAAVHRHPFIHSFIQENKVNPLIKNVKLIFCSCRPRCVSRSPGASLQCAGIHYKLHQPKRFAFSMKFPHAKITWMDSSQPKPHNNCIDGFLVLQKLYAPAFKSALLQHTGTDEQARQGRTSVKV